MADKANKNLNDLDAGLPRRRGRPPRMATAGFQPTPTKDPMIGNFNRGPPTA